MSAVETIKVDIDEAGMRLDRWFKLHYPGLGFSHLQKLMRSGQVRIDGGRVQPSTRVAAGRKKCRRLCPWIGCSVACRHFFRPCACAGFDMSAVETIKVDIDEAGMRLAAFLMGTLIAWLAFKADMTGWPGTLFGSGQNLRLFLATGLLGGFTTFSAFSLDAMLLWERGETALAAFYVLGSVVLSLAGLFAGLALVRALI